jgi:hypothetical protein
LHAPCGKRWRSKTGAICAYKLGALDGRSAGLQICFGRQSYVPEKIPTNRANRHPKGPTGSPNLPMHSTRLEPSHHALLSHLNLRKKQYRSPHSRSLSSRVDLDGSPRRYSTGTQY